VIVPHHDGDPVGTARGEHADVRCAAHAVLVAQLRAQRQVVDDLGLDRDPRPPGVRVVGVGVGGRFVDVGVGRGVELQEARSLALPSM